MPDGEVPPLKLGAFPWLITSESLTKASPTRRDWGSAWVLLADSEETLDLASFAGLVCGNDGPVERAACWLALRPPQWMFRLKNGMIDARSGAELKQHRQENKTRQLDLAKRQACSDMLVRRTALEESSVDQGLLTWLDQMADLATGKSSLKDLDGSLQSVLKDLDLDCDSVELHRALVSLGRIDSHRLPSMQTSRWSDGFSESLEQEAASLVAGSDALQPGDAGRLDLSHLYCVTVDDPQTRELDDALSLERLDNGDERIWVHIADPTRLITPDSGLDREAAARGSTLYLAQGTQSMFPTSLSHGPLSLRAGRRNAALSTWIQLDGDGAINAYGITRSWVQPHYRLSYEDADELIDLAPPQEADLAELDALLQRRRAWRERNGALMMDLPEGRIRCRDDKAVVEITEPSPSRQMVAEAMILAGAATAQFAIDQNLALPFRSQLPAQLPPAEELATLPEGAVRFSAIKRHLSRGLVGTTPSQHFSLGLPAYVQATSPIRRYGDLITQRQIVACLDGGPCLDADTLQQILNNLELATREGISISREDQRHWQQVWFEQHAGDTWPVDFLRWLRPQEHLGLVRIDSLALDLAAQCPQGSEPGDRWQLSIVGVDSSADLLKLRAS